MSMTSYREMELKFGYNQLALDRRRPLTRCIDFATINSGHETRPLELGSTWSLRDQRRRRSTEWRQRPVFLMAASIGQRAATNHNKPDDLIFTQQYRSEENSLSKERIRPRRYSVVVPAVEFSLDGNSLGTRLHWSKKKGTDIFNLYVTPSVLQLAFHFF